MRILHLGAGRIGLGLIVPFFSVDNDIVVVDRNTKKVASIESNGGYNLHTLWYGNETIKFINDFSITTYENYKFDQNIDLITTSVIVKNLPDIAPFIKDVISRNVGHIYIATMENSFEAPGILDEELQKIGADHNRYTLLNSVIDKIVPEYDGKLNVYGEPFSHVKINEHPGFSLISQNQQILSKNIKLEAEKKLLLVNGLHASAAYLGYLNGNQLISEVVNSKSGYEALRNVGFCYIDYLNDLYGCEISLLQDMVSKSLERFGNYSIKDPLERVGRNLMIKLSANERIRRPMEYNKSRGLRYKALEEVIEAAAHFKIGNDFSEYSNFLTKCD